MIGNLVMEQLKKLDKVALSVLPLSTAVSKISKNLAKRRAPGGLSRAGRVLHGAGAKAAQRGRFTTHPNPNVGCVIVKMAKLSVKVTINERVNRMPRTRVAHGRRKSQRRNGVCHTRPCSHHGRTPPCCDALIAAGGRAWLLQCKTPIRRSLDVDFPSATGWH